MNHNSGNRNCDLMTNSTITPNCGVKTLVVDKVLKSPFNKHNSENIKYKILTNYLLLATNKYV